MTLPMTLSDPLPPKWLIFVTFRPPFASLARMKLDTSNLA